MIERMVWIPVIIALICLGKQVAVLGKRLRAVERENEELRTAACTERKTATVPEAVQVPEPESAPVPSKAATTAAPPMVPQVEAGVPPETVAVIMAAVTACGYVPTAIRAVRHTRRRSKKWIIAGRIARMR